ncbi:Vacuolar protein sorting-associated protein 28-like 2 [Durusdinium trenchii]|uniref:Vacuolar protein sorting-associated protein 28-like 2 n=1 Tax=Durusdinium trenchii TaxID=1381693 RepID=A0ABP0NQL7_9DINO
MALYVENICIIWATEKHRGLSAQKHTLATKLATKMATKMELFKATRETQMELYANAYRGITLTASGGTLHGELRPVSFQLKRGAEAKYLKFGFIAQELETVFPNLEHDEYKQKVLEQDAELQDLKKRLDRLERPTAQ